MKSVGYGSLGGGWQRQKGRGNHSSPLIAAPVTLYFLLSLTSVYSASTTSLSSVLAPALPSGAALSPVAWASAYIFSPSFCATCASACDLASIAALSSDLSTASASLIAVSIFSFSPASSLSPYSVSDFLTECTSA